MGERFAWFTDSIEKFGEVSHLTPSQFAGLIEEYELQNDNKLYI